MEESVNTPGSARGFGHTPEEGELQRDRLLLETLPHVAFEGWTDRALRNGVADAGLPPEAAALVFPDGAAEMVAHWSRWADARMREAMGRPGNEEARLRERIAAAVRFRIEVDIPYREAVRRTLAWLSLPPNMPLALRCTWETVNGLWYACGDTATDFSFYSKRASLAAVYGATVLYWLDDESEDFVDTWAFLDRRIDGVMQLPRLQSRVQDALRRLRMPRSPLSGTPGT